MNMVEKILAKASGQESVKPGDVVVANVDTLLLHDLSGYITANVFENEVKKEMRYPERVAMVFDHHFRRRLKRELMFWNAIGNLQGDTRFICLIVVPVIFIM